MRLVVASQNSGKLSEFQSILGVFGVECVLPFALNSSVIFPEEIGTTFAQNAGLKARSIFDQTGQSVIADDSGLEVAALSGFPGIQSARWLPGSDQQRNEGLLKKLTKNTDRIAKFVCVLCLITSKHSKPVFFTGELLGSIAQVSQGKAGFGYDPIFIPKGETQTLAQLSPNYKNNHSHRALALKKFGTYFLENVLN